MTATYTFPTEISMNLAYLADIFYDATVDCISENYEVEEVPKEIKLQILKDAARYVLANF